MNKKRSRKLFLLPKPKNQSDHQNVIKLVHPKSKGQAFSADQLLQQIETLREQQNLNHCILLELLHTIELKLDRLEAE